MNMGKSTGESETSLVNWLMSPFYGHFFGGSSDSTSAEVCRWFCFAVKHRCWDAGQWHFPTESKSQWIGFVENIWTGNPWVFTCFYHQIIGVSCKFSHPILWKRNMGRNGRGDLSTSARRTRIVWTSDPGSSTDSLELQLPGALRGRNGWPGW